MEVSIGPCIHGKQDHEKCTECESGTLLISDETADFLGLRKKVPPTEAQLSYAHRLLRERAPYGAAKDAEESNGPEAAHEYVNGLDKTEISKFIQAMRFRDKRKVSARTSAAKVGEGTYKVGNDKDGYEIYRVKRAFHGSGHLYAQMLVGSPEHNEWVFAPGIVHTLREEDRMTVEDAGKFGALYGKCMKCGRILTDEQSMAEGVGPICKQNEGGWFA